MHESREHIKTRMLKNAARAWGYSETESESNFDPLVSMLLSACSVELEKISGEIHGSRARVLERLVQLLSPDAFTGALPAHSVACATPVENTLEINEEAQYYITRKLPALPDTEEPVTNEIFFSPAGSFLLNKAAIRFMATGRYLYRVSNNITKEMIAQADAGKELPANTLWLGIDEPGNAAQIVVPGAARRGPMREGQRGHVIGIHRVGQLARKPQKRLALGGVARHPSQHIEHAAVDPFPADFGLRAQRKPTVIEREVQGALKPQLGEQLRQRGPQTGTAAGEDRRAPSQQGFVFTHAGAQAGQSRNGTPQ